MAESVVYPSSPGQPGTPRRRYRTHFRRPAEGGVVATPEDVTTTAEAHAFGLDPDDWDSSRLPKSPLRALLQETVGPALRYPRRLVAFLGTSPGRVTMVSTVLVVAILAAGLSMAYTTSKRQEALAALSTDAEPLSNAAQNLYSSLSEADATANTAFIQGGVETPAMRERYDAAMTRSSLAVLRAATGMSETSGDTMELITDIQGRLPVYAGLVEAARANNRAGNPVGVAYQSSASSVMRFEILPAAAQLHTLTTDRLDREQAAQSTIPWFPLSGLGAAVLMLLLAHYWLSRRTKRQVNFGLAAAAALMVLALVSVGATATVTWYNSSAAFQRTAHPLTALTQARITAQQARSAETLSLVERSGLGDSNSFAEATTSIEDALADARDRFADPSTVDLASESVERWRSAHTMTGYRQDTGDYPGALAIITGTDPELNSADAFDTLDGALQELITSTRSDLRGFISDTQTFSARLSTLVLLLSLAAAGSVALGVRPRLQEYL